MTADYIKAKEKAEEILRLFRIEGNITPVFDIAERFQIQIKIVNMPDNMQAVAGFLSQDGKAIYVNADDAPNRQTFTVAHELGHFFLDHKPEERGVLFRITTLNNTPIESEANCFAANLLVPEEKIRKVISDYHLKASDAGLIAKIFGVSEEVILHRLKHI